MKKDMPTHWVMDYETLVNCFVGVFQHYKDDSISEIFVVNQDQNDLPKFIEFLNKCIQLNQWHISYNGIAFDAQISQHIIKNQRKLLSLTGLEAAQYIYKLAQDIITRSDRGEFQEFAPRQLKIRQIDLFKMNHWDNKAKMSSLKWIQYSMDWDNVEEMPHHHTTPVESAEQLQDIIQYCINDVLSTKKILEHSKEQIELRKTLTNEYGIDLYSASEPRISKELFLFFLEQKLGWDKAEIKRLRTKRDEIYLGQCILPYVKFQTPEFQKIHDYFRTKVVTSTKDKLKFTLDYKGVKTDYGLGGIHGAKDSGVYEAHPGWTIMTSDVTSFYPNLAIKNKFHPAHLPQKEFGDLYEWFFEERKKIPKSDPKNYVYKIILNSTYGLTGDENSFLYDPQMTMQITINGQLLLSMLYEMLCLEIPEGIPLMQNTDGLEMMIPTSAVSKYMEVCDKWCLLTQLQLEHDEYSKMVIADVNNYIAVYKNGKVKCKGKFEWEDLEKKKVAMLHKNKSFLIIPKAIYAYFVNGIPPEEFLAQSRSFYDYCAGVKAKGGWYYEERSLVKGELVTNKLQKIVRYYVTKSGNKILKRHPDGREMQVEAGQWMQKTVNEIDPNIPYEAYDIDTEYYLENIYKQIEQINKVSHASFTQLSLF
jgi:hypothetical protein